jgi:VWFA-related protein
MMKTSSVLSAALAAVIISLSPVTTLTQDKTKADQGPIKLNAELVQIDVLVTDKAGKPVGGLKRDDFELLDNNKAQQISTFAYEETKARRIGDTVLENRRLPKAITAGELKRVFAFVVDTLHIKFENVNQTRKMLGDFVDNKMQPGDLVLILPTGGGSGVLQQFTSDPRLLHRAIDRLHPFFFTNDTTPYRSTDRLSGERALRGQSPVNSVPGGLSMPSVGNVSGSVDPLEESDVRATLWGLKDTIKSMSKLPGRKVAVLVSEGVRLYATETTQDLNQTTALAARSNVVFYTIDPRGLQPLMPDAGDVVSLSSGGTPQQGGVEILTPREHSITGSRTYSDFLESQNSLRIIASDTGGKFFGNNNDITRGLDQLVEENSAYYMLGFYPAAGKWDGKFHKVKVVVRGRPELAVSFRKGYLAKTPPPENAGFDPKVAEAIEAISSPLVRRDIDLRLTPLYIDDAQRDPAVTLLLHIDTSKLTFVQSEGRYHDQLEEVGFVFDANGKPIDTFSNNLELNLLPQSYQTALKRGFIATRTMNVKPGTYQVRLFVREAMSGLIGTANDFIDIPNMKAEKLTTSSLFLSGQSVERGKVVDTAGIGGTPAQRRFQRTGEFAYSLVIYNPRLDDKSKQPQMEMRTRILKGNKIVFTGGLRPVVAGEGSALPFRIVTGGVIKLASLAPDDYTIEVTVIDKLRKKEESVIRREMDFSVE